MSDEDQKQKDIERGNAYREMMNLWAWKDFMKMLDEHREMAITDFSNASEGTGFTLGTIKGRVQEIEKIKSDVGYIVSIDK